MLFVSFGLLFVVVVDIWKRLRVFVRANKSIGSDGFKRTNTDIHAHKTGKRPKLDRQIQTDSSVQLVWFPQLLLLVLLALD